MEHQLGQHILALLDKNFKHIQTVGILFQTVIQIELFNLDIMALTELGLQMMVKFIMEVVVQETSIGDRVMTALDLL